LGVAQDNLDSGDWIYASDGKATNPDMPYQIIDEVMARAIHADAARSYPLFAWIIMHDLPCLCSSPDDGRAHAIHLTRPHAGRVACDAPARVGALAAPAVRRAGGRGDLIPEIGRTRTPAARRPGTPPRVAACRWFSIASATASGMLASPSALANDQRKSCQVQSSSSASPSSLFWTLAPLRPPSDCRARYQQ